MKIHTSQFLLFLILALMISNYYCLAQVNLVTNPSFEEYTNCPNSSYQTHYLDSWDIDYNTADFYHECSTLNYSLPQNVMGYQCASTGNGYAGLIFYGILNSLPPLNIREYIGGNLSDTLTIGTKYFVSFKVSLAENTFSSNNNLGIKFTTLNLVNSNSFTPYIVQPPPFIDNFSQVNYNNIISDSIGWISIKGSFTADSSYINFLIGDFFTTSMTDSILKPGYTTCQSYYYIDDVCVSTDSLHCEHIKEQLISISADSNNVTQNSCIDFNLQTIINFNSYEWLFDGGIPSASNQSNPSNICYQNVGDYDVTFIGHKNGGCTDTLKLPNFIHVDTATSTKDYFTTTKNFEIIFSENILKVLDLHEHIEFNIYDIVGKTINSGKLTSEYTIDCNYLTSGTYIFKTNNSSIKPYKFIINPKSN